MGLYLNAADLPSWANAAGADAEAAIAVVEELARQVAPCLFPTRLPQFEQRVKDVLLFPTAQMAATRGGLVARQASGPFSVEFRDGVGVSLSPRAVEALVALCGGTEDSGGPQWSFPAAGDYSSLFANPRRTL